MEFEKPNQINIAVVGLGYVGLPTALSFHDAGYKVVGIDASEYVIDTLRQGSHHLIEESSMLTIPVKSNRWAVTANYFGTIQKSDLILITVPTPVNKQKKPDLSYVESACKSVLENLTKGKSTIILESTVYPGVTRSVLSRISKDLDLELGKEFNFGYSPERVSPGDVGRSSSEVAKIVGTDDEELGKKLVGIYSSITTGGCTYVGSPEVAEAAKLIENTQRDIDIAFANELAVVLPKMGLDVEDVLEAASTKWNFHRHTPGIGIGGHCIPVDPYFYIEISEKLGFKSVMSTAARKMNMDIETISAEEIIKIIRRFSFENIIFLGYSYKPNVGDVRETPVKRICELVNEVTGIVPMIWDLLVEKGDVPGWLNYIEDLEKVPSSTMFVVGTAHQSVKNINYLRLKEKLENPVIYDGRRALDLEMLEESGWGVFAIGRPEIQLNGD